MLPGFRGGARERHLLFESDLGEIDLRIEAAPDSTRRIIGQIDPDAAGAVSVVRFIHAGQTSAVASAVVDELGVFMTAIPAGRYVLCVESARATVRTPEFDA